jgi:tripeptide aminopeptidase
MMNNDRMLKEFFKLVKMTCSSGKEREAADYVTEQLKKLGFSVVEDVEAGKKFGGNTGNIVANLSGTVVGAPTIMLSAHLDSVEPCSDIEPVLEEGIIRSKGETVLGSDDKAGVTAILETLRTIQEEKLPHGPIQAVFTVGEESGLHGSHYIDRSLLTADYGYALDSGGPVGEICVLAPGQDQIDVVIHGKKAHAGMAPEEGINAIVVAGKALSVVKQGRLDFETTANIGIIAGGIATNIVPDKVELKCEARSRNLDKLAAQVAHMKTTFENVATAEGATANVTVTRAYGPFVLDESTPVVQNAVKAAQALSLEPKIVGTGGGSDANYFNSYGVPCAVLGVGMSKVHTTEEFIKESDLYLSAQYVLALLQKAAESI